MLKTTFHDYGVRNDIALDVAAFRATPKFEKSLEMPVSDSTVNNLLAAADHNDARADALPQYLQWYGRPWSEHSPELEQVQIIKVAELERVRFRAVADYPMDVELQAVLQGMRGAALAGLPATGGGMDVSDLQWPPHYGSDGSHQFLTHAHRRPLWVTQLKDLETLRDEYKTLLQ